MTEFSQRFELLANIELLKILNEQEEYQKEAIVAVKEELKKRNISDQELVELKAELEKQNSAKKKKQEKIEEIESKFKNYAKNIGNKINPIQKGIQTSERIIRFITIIFTGILIFNFYEEFGLISSFFFDWIMGWEVILYFSFILIPPIAIFLFWKRKKIGWILLSYVFSYLTVRALFMFFVILDIEANQNSLSYLNEISVVASPITFLFKVLLFGGGLFMLFNKEIRAIYKVKKYMLFIPIAVSICVYGILIFNFY